MCDVEVLFVLVFIILISVELCFNVLPGKFNCGLCMEIQHN